MGAMKDIDIMVKSLRLDKFYNVEYMDEDVVVKKQHIKYIGKHKDLLDGIEKLLFQVSNDFDIMINPCMLINVEPVKKDNEGVMIEGDNLVYLKKFEIPLIKQQWNYDELKIGKAYRLLKINKGEMSGFAFIKEIDAILKEITNDYLLFIAADEIDGEQEEILVKPGLEATEYSVYKMDVIQYEKTK